MFEVRERIIAVTNGPATGPSACRRVANGLKTVMLVLPASISWSTQDTGFQMPKKKVEPHRVMKPKAARKRAADARDKSLENDITTAFNRIERIEEAAEKLAKAVLESFFVIAKTMKDDAAELERLIAAQNNLITGVCNRFVDLTEYPKLDGFRSQTKDSIARILDEGLIPIPWQVGNPR